jgi:sterol desaturase/sphingolipid hydroxylase (fatty acid hydroxylase superfamily)
MADNTAFRFTVIRKETGTLHMNVLIIDHQLVIRLTVFFAIFLLMAAWEVFAPRRTLRASKPVRWFNNLSITFFDAFVGRFVFPLSAVSLAILAEERGWGAFNYLRVNSVAAGVISIVLLDLAIYLQHVVFHKVRVLWFIHGMHHTDLDIDVTTGARFHPVEIVFSMLIKMGIILLVGIPAWSFLVFEILLNGTSMFNHSNIHISQKVDRLLRLVLVTPDMHRVHHSVIIREHDSNFGFNLPWWDRLLGTYRDQPKEGHDNMVIGLANFRDPKGLSFPRLLAQPFVKWKKF